MASVDDRIKSTIEGAPVVLFMKGTRDLPQCGFSAQVVQVLDSLGADYTTVNVLNDPEVRDGIKAYSRWPTIPQLYVRGEFVGGCDIVRELYANGELEQKLGVASKPVAVPRVRISEQASQAFREAIENEDEYVRLEVSGQYEHGLSIGPKQPGDIEVSGGSLTILVGRSSAARAEGVSIDYIDTPSGPAFKIENPNEPPHVRSLSAMELKAKLDAGDKLELIDVRTPEEREIASIEGARLLDDSLLQELSRADKDTTLVFHCHHGSRSQSAAEQFVAQGFRSVYNLTGGIDAWALDVDPDVSRY
ncbi:MAG TPA: Grx4 family monothiol glutaredoxin [Polyangiaceae bacterium]